MHLKIVVLAALFAGTFPVLAFETSDADVAFKSYNSNFYAQSNGLGFYKKSTTGGRSEFWTQAEQIEMILDVFDRTHSADGAKMAREAIAGFTDRYGRDWSANKYNDDIAWMAIACARAYTATGEVLYRDLARSNFDTMYARAADDVLGGGLWWTTEKTGKHACIVGPAAIAACLLSKTCDDKSYLNKAQAMFAWERNTLFNHTNGAVFDNIRTNGVIGRRAFTYNEGTFIGAADLLFKQSGDTNYLNDAILAANFTRHNLSRGGNLPVYGSGDAAGFNGIFVRWLARLANDNHLWPQFYDWMSANAGAAWRVRRADNLSWQNWNQPTPDGVLESWNCSDTVVILQLVPSRPPEK